MKSHIRCYSYPDWCYYICDGRVARIDVGSEYFNTWDELFEFNSVPYFGF